MSVRFKYHNNCVVHDFPSQMLTSLLAVDRLFPLRLTVTSKIQINLLQKPFFSSLKGYFLCPCFFSFFLLSLALAFLKRHLGCRSSSSGLFVCAIFFIGLYIGLLHPDFCFNNTLSNHKFPGLLFLEQSRHDFVSTYL